MTRPAPASAGERGSVLAWALVLALSVVLGLVLAAAGSALGPGGSGTVAVDALAGDQAWNCDRPSQPPLRELEVELGDGSEDSDDERIDAGSGSAPALVGAAVRVDALTFVGAPGELSERERASSSARGPPQA